MSDLPETETVTLWLSTHVLDYFRQQASRTGQDVESLINTVLKDYVAQELQNRQ